MMDFLREIGVSPGVAVVAVLVIAAGCRRLYRRSKELAESFQHDLKELETEREELE